MILPQTPYTTMFVLLSTISILLGIYIWQRFRGPEAALGMLIILASVEWILVSILQLGSADLSIKLFWNKVKYIGLVVPPTAWLVFTIFYTGHGEWVTRRNVAFLSSIPVITLVLTFTNEYHGLIWESITLEAEDSFLVVHHTSGVWFLINVVYTYILLVGGSFLLIQMIIHYRSLFRWQSFALLVGALLPLLWSMLYLAGLNLYSYLEPTPLLFPVVNLAIIFVLLYVRTLDIVPVARETVIDSMSDSVIVLDSQNRVVDMNPSAQQFIRHGRSNFIGKSIEEVWPDWSDQMNFNELTEGGKEIVLTQEGEQHIYDLRISSLMSWRGDPISHVIVIRDITERKKAEEEIKKFKTISDRAGYGTAIHDLEGNLIYVNETFAKMHGYTAEELCGKNMVILYSEEHLSPNRLNELKKGGNYTAEEVHHKRKDNTGFPALVSRTLIKDDKENPLFVAVTAVDITKRKQAEDKIKQSLQEKEILLREIHHRVKNNLQIISSLLSLQSRYIKDKKDLEMIEESQDRIRSMALIHEKLYQSENLADIDFDDYITDMVNRLIQLHGAGDITLTIDAGTVSLGIDAAIPCGLIINELVSNCLKHAFSGGKGEIRILLHSVNGHIELVVSDNGVGVPEDFDFRHTDTLGLRLVTILAEDQLNGDIRLIRTKGTEFRITFEQDSG